MITQIKVFITSLTLLALIIYIEGYSEKFYEFFSLLLSEIFFQLALYLAYRWSNV